MLWLLLYTLLLMAIIKAACFACVSPFNTGVIFPFGRCHINILFSEFIIFVDCYNTDCDYDLIIYLLFSLLFIYSVLIPELQNNGSCLYNGIDMSVTYIRCRLLLLDFIITHKNG